MTNRRYKTGTAREQISLLPASIEDYVSSDALVRAIDLYVDTLELEELGFLHADGGHAQGKGQPAYDPRDHLKLYLYGYPPAKLDKHACVCQTVSCKVMISKRKGSQ